MIRIGGLVFEYPGHRALHGIGLPDILYQRE